MSESFASVPKDLDRGMAAAFRDSPVDYDMGSSVIGRLQEHSGLKFEVHLPEPVGEQEGPVVHVDARASGDEPVQAGRYQVQGEIARGGVGVVFRGRDQDLGRDVAIKVLGDRHAGDPEMLARFVEEAQIGGQLQHPGIVPVYELGLKPDGGPFFAMKLIKGETLSSLLKKRANASEERRRFLGIFEQVCQTVAYAHARGVIHRDLKPSNVMVGAFGEVQVVDWGLAKILRRESEPHAPKQEKNEEAVSVISSSRSRSGSESMTGSVMGTPAYMPPEQALGEVETMDARSDVFSLGAILAEMLTGAPPYTGSRESVLRQASLCTTDPLLEGLRGQGLDAELVGLVDDCLREKPDARPHDAEVVAKRIGSYVTGVEERAHAAELRSAQAKVRVRWAGGLAVATMLLAVGGTWSYVHGENRRAEQVRLASIEVTAALDEARTLDGMARALLEEDGASAVGLARLSEALTAAEKAGVLAMNAHASLSAEVGNYLADMRVRIETAGGVAETLQRHRSLVEALLSARVPADHNLVGDMYFEREASRLDQEYDRIFREHGLDIGKVSVRAGAAYLRGSLDREIAAALEYWGSRRRYLETKWARRPTVMRERGIPELTGPFGQPLDLAQELLEFDEWSKLIHQQIAVGRPNLDVLNDLRQTLIQQDKPPESWSLLSWLFDWTDEYEVALEVLELGQCRYPDDFMLTLEAGMHHSWAGNHAGAARNYAAARALRPDLLRVQVWLSTQLDEEHPELAVSILEALALAEPENVVWTWRVADKMAKFGRGSESIEAYRRALRIDPSEEALQWEFGSELFRQNKNLEEAADLMSRSLGKGRVELKGARCRVLGNLLASLGRPEEAGAAYTEAIRLEPENPWAYCNLGLELEELGLYSQAIKPLRRGHELGSQQANWKYPSGQYIEEVEDFIAREPYFRELADGTKTSTVALDWARVAMYLDHQRRYHESVKAWMRAFELSPELLDDTSMEYCYMAAEVAAVASEDESGDLSLRQRRQLRSLALEWLGVVLMHCTEAVEDDPSTVLYTLTLLQREYKLRSVRDPQLLQELTPGEQSSCGAFWTDAAALLEQSRCGEECCRGLFEMLVRPSASPQSGQ